MIETNVKKEQQLLHSLRPMGEGGRRPDEGLKETGRLACTTTLETAKGGQQSLHSFAPWGEGQDEGSYQCDKTGMTPHQGRLACTNTLATAKEVRSTSSCSFAPWGEGQDEGSYKLDATGMTPHQVRTKLANSLDAR